MQPTLIPIPHNTSNSVCQYKSISVYDGTCGISSPITIRAFADSSLQSNSCALRNISSYAYMWDKSKASQNSHEQSGVVNHILPGNNGKKNYATALTGIWYQNVINKSVADKKMTTSFCQYIIFFSPTSKDENEQEHTIVSTYSKYIHRSQVGKIRYTYTPTDIYLLYLLLIT